MKQLLKYVIQRSGYFCTSQFNGCHKLRDNSQRYVDPNGRNTSLAALTNASIHFCHFHPPTMKSFCLKFN